MDTFTALKILGLSARSTPAQVKSAYRALAHKHHPDRNPDDPDSGARFHQCSEAYQFLIEHIDDWLVETVSVPQPQVVQDLNNIFDDIFGFTREGRVFGYEKPEILPVTLAEIAFGTSKTARLKVFQKCERCLGSGSSKSDRAHICTHCFGAGSIHVENDIRLCQRCQGRGRLVDHPCRTCNGFGRRGVYEKHAIEVKPGSTIHVPYTMNVERKNGEVADVFVAYVQKEQSLVSIRKWDVHYEFPILKADLESSQEIEIPTLWGWVKVSSEAILKSGSVLEIKGYGLYNNMSKTDRGNLYLHLYVLSGKKYRKMNDEFFKEISRDNPHYPKPKSWWKKLFG